MTPQQKTALIHQAFYELLIELNCQKISNDEIAYVLMDYCREILFDRYRFIETMKTKVAGRVGVEPTTDRLTADCSTD